MAEVGEVFPGTNEKIVAKVPAPGGGFLLLGQAGGVFNEGGSAFHGSYLGLDAVHRQGPQREFERIETRPDGGYTTFDKGNAVGYSFGPTAPIPKKSLYEDPTFLAFQRASGLGVETLAADVAARENAINAALTTSVANRKVSGEDERRGVDNNFEARGVFRSSARNDRRSEQEARQAGDIGGLETTAATQIGGLKSELYKGITDQQTKASEMGLSIDAGAYGRDQDNILGGIKTAGENAYAAAKRRYQEINGSSY